MVKQPVPFDALGEYPGKQLQFSLELPDYVDTENMAFHTRRLVTIAFLLGGPRKPLHIVSEAGQTTERHYDMSISDGDNLFGIDNVRGRHEKINIARTVAAHESEEAAGANWIVLNNTEIFERIQLAEYAGDLVVRIASGNTMEHPGRPHSFMWSKVMNRAIGLGIRNLAMKNMSHNPLHLPRTPFMLGISRLPFIECAVGEFDTPHKTVV